MTRIAIVTGGASGIGLALGAALVGRGWHVVLDDVHGAEAQQEAVRLSRAGPGSAVAAGVDVRDADALITLVRDTHAEHGRLDLMVNNAGVLGIGEPDELELVHWDAILDTNLRGVIHGCHAAYPLMKQQGFGTILNTASLAGILPATGFDGPYATAKHGVVGLSLALRSAGADYGVKVTALCPGFIDTPIFDRSWPDGLPIPASLQHGPSLREAWQAAGVTFYPPDRLAEDTLAGLTKNKAILVIPGEWRRSWLLARLLPGLTTRRSQHLTRRLRASLYASSPSAQTRGSHTLSPR